MMNRRVRTGCGTCRKRRIKCDEAKPTCLRCRAANYDCNGYEQARKVTSPKFIKQHILPPVRKPSPPEILSPHIPSRGLNWRQEHLPLYHHFVTSTVHRLFRDDHVIFWRDKVAQMSYEVDSVYEALLAIAAAHRGALLSCISGDAQEITKWKVTGLSAYGKSVRSVAGNGCNMQEASIPALKGKLIALILLAYFECFMESQTGVFRHLWVAIQMLQIYQGRTSPEEATQMVPVREVILRLDHLAQKLVPFSQSSFLRGTNSALLQSPFWNRPSLEFATAADPINTEGNSLVRLVGGHNHINRVVWGLWYPVSERANREELLGFYSEMLLWKRTSPATFSSCPKLDDLHLENIEGFYSLPMPPIPLHFTSVEAALNVIMFNGYLGCALAMVSTTDEDPAPRELEIFRLACQNLRIAAGLLNMGGQPASNSYKPCEALNSGICLYLYHQARRLFAPSWQEFTITVLRTIGREGLSNGHTLATTLDIQNHLQPKTQNHASPLGRIRDRLVPMLIPPGDDGLQTAFYLGYGTIWDATDENVVRVVAKATWRQNETGAMETLKLDTVSPGDDTVPSFSDIPRSPRLLSPWRNSVETGWHGLLSASMIN